MCTFPMRRRTPLFGDRNRLRSAHTCHQMTAKSLYLEEGRTDELLSCQTPIIFQCLPILPFHHTLAEGPTVLSHRHGLHRSEEVIKVKDQPCELKPLSFADTSIVLYRSLTLSIFIAVYQEAEKVALLTQARGRCTLSTCRLLP